MNLPAPEQRNFLIVEDSAAMRQLLSMHLKNFKGSRILEAGNGAEALKKLNAEKVDIIFTDINMPVMDGLKLISFVRQDPRFKAIPIVIITTLGAEEDRDRGLALGANAYIAKPIQYSLLARTVQELLPATPSGSAGNSASQ